MLTKCEEILAKWLPMDRTNTSAGSCREECFQASEQEHKFDVFLSHSGKQKNFVRQLYKDLTNQRVSCFFDQDPESLPVAENFPPRIFEAAKTCKVAVLLLSKDFLESLWPMLELSAFVEARDKKPTNPNLKILPLFFLISPDALKNTEGNDENWEKKGITGEKRSEWHRALKAIGSIKGLLLGEGGDEVKFRDEIVKEIWRILPTPSPRYHGPVMQGEARMCREVANLFSKVQPNKYGIRIAGLYGIAGDGKTTLGRAFCNFKLADFEGRVCHLEFSGGDPIQNIRFALKYLTHGPESYVQTLRSCDEAKVELDRRLKQQRVLLVLDNITEESIEEVASYLKAELGKDSWILLSARSVVVLEKYFLIDSQSCIRVPRLEEEEAIAILLTSALPVESSLKADDRGFALKCAKRCLFNDKSCDIGLRARSFHPLALKAFGGHLLRTYGLNSTKWVDAIDGMVDGAGDGLDEVFIVLGKAFDNMHPKYLTIFMLLTVYVLPSMCSSKVCHWLAINCNEDISFIGKAVEDLRNNAFIEEFEPEIRVHDLYIEFAQSKANKMKRWLWWKTQDDQFSTCSLIAQDKDGFELAKLQQCLYRRIAPKYLGNLLVLQLVDVNMEKMSKLDLGPMHSLRSITLLDCESLVAVDGMEKFIDLGWVQIRGVHPMFKLPELRSLEGLQHLEIDIAGSQVVDELGDLTHCSRLREIYVACPSLLEFPKLKGMKHLEKLEFTSCYKAKGVLDCRDCEKLQTIVLNFCCQMAAAPLLTGCEKLSKLILWECEAMTACPDVPSTLKTLHLSVSSKAASAPKNVESCCNLENLQLWNMGELMELPSFRRLSNLTVLKLVKCGIREVPNLTCCDKLEDVCFFTLRNLDKFPSFSSLRELKKLSLCNCIRVRHPPNVEGCHQLQVFHLLYNDNMEGLSKMDKCGQLEEIQMSWHCEGEVTYKRFNRRCPQVDDDLESCLENWKDEKIRNTSAVILPEALKELQWLKGKTMLVKRYFRRGKLYYSLTAPYKI